MKICAYISGDKNIIYPSIVCLSSVKKHNKNIDLFLFTEKNYTTDEHIRLCNKYNITIIDINEIDKNGIINNFQCFRRWPIQVFYNYIAPYFLYSIGYEYGIKLDYDMLCVDSFIIDEILPNKNECVTVMLKRNLSTYIDKNNLDKLKLKFKVDNCRSVNAGLIVFDLEYFNQKNIAQLYGNIIKYFGNQEIISEETSEQFCFGLLQELLGINFKNLEYTYNFRPYVETKIINNVKVIHYNTMLKPWIKFNTDDMQKWNNKYGYIRQAMLANYWIEYANTIDFTETWYHNQNFSIKEIYNIFNLSMKYLDANERKLLLERYALFIQNNNDKKLNFFYDEKYKYLQIRAFYENNIHYEIVFKGSNIAICIHFEKEWGNYGDYLKNTIAKLIRINMICNPKKAEIYYLIKDANDINTVCNATKTIIEQTYDSIAFFLNMHNVYMYIQNRHILLQKISQSIRNIDEKIKYIYEATVGEKKDNYNFVFDTVYKQKIWGGTSGSGSNPDTLQEYIHFLESFIRSNHITSISDIGCGDWQYMRYVNLEGIDYTGYDVASSIIERNRKEFSKNNINFVLYDGNFADVKISDMAICKDVLQHLPNKNIFEFIKNIKKFKYALVANNIADNMTSNLDISMGQCRPLDLRLPPFNIDAEHVFTIDRRHLKKANIMVLLIKN